MALSINTNIASLNAQRNLNKSQGSLNNAMQRLSSGLRINSAKDDAAGLAVSDRMTAQIRGLNQAARNANDGISLAQTAEGALQESTNILQRMRELAVQSANDTNTTSDRASLQAEVAQLKSELERIAETSQFNGKNLLDGSMSNASFQVGANAGANETISFKIASAKTADLSMVGTTITGGSAVKSNNVAGSAFAAGDLSVNGKSVAANSGTNVALASAINAANSGGDSSIADIASAVNVQTFDFNAVSLNGSTPVTETATFTFADITSGQTVTIAGRTITAGGSGATAAELKTAFSSGNTTGGATVSGTLDAAWTVAAHADAGKVVFTSATANANVTDLASSGTATAPTVSRQQGVSASTPTGTYTLTFDGSTSVNVAAVAGTSVTAQKVVDAINASSGGATGFTAALTSDGKISIAKDDATSFTLAEAIDLDGGGAGAAEGAASGLVGVDSTATYRGQVSFNSASDIVLTGSGSEAAGLKGVGNESTTINNLNISTREGATVAISSVDAALAQINNIRGDLGAVQNRFESTIANLQSVSENLSAARGRILDADIAQETAAMTKNNILQQAGVSILAQANQLPQLALSLLGGQ